MTSPASPTAAAEARSVLTPALTLLLAAACGLIAANLYYAQPLIAPIAQALGIAPGTAGLIVTMCQLGYGLGLLFIVPLGDLLENRRLIVGIMLIGIVALIVAALSGNAVTFLSAALFIGLGSVSVQVIVPYAASLADDSQRGRVVGNVMSGLMLGIMLARPVASALASVAGWHAIFWVSAVAMAALALLLRSRLPARHPPQGSSYGAILRSMVQLLLNEPVLQRRAAAHACMFGAFSLYWTVVPLELSQGFGLGQRGIALFALAGVAGVLAAPVAGRLSDRGLGRQGAVLALSLGALSFVIGIAGGSGSSALHLALLVLSGMLLDCGVTANLVFTQREIYGISAEARGRINGLFMALFFAGGAIGSALGGWTWSAGGWPLSAVLGGLMPLCGLAVLALTAHRVRA